MQIVQALYFIMPTAQAYEAIILGPGTLMITIANLCT